MLLNSNRRIHDCKLVHVLNGEYFTTLQAMKQEGGEPFQALPCDVFPFMQCNRYCSKLVCDPSPHTHFYFDDSDQSKQFQACCQHILQISPDQPTNHYYYDPGANCYRICQHVGRGHPFILVTTAQFNQLLGYKIQISSLELNSKGLRHQAVYAVKNNIPMRLEALLFGVHHSRVILLDRTLLNFAPNQVKILSSQFVLPKGRWPYLKGLHRNANSVSWRKPTGKMNRNMYPFNPTDFNSFHTAVKLLVGSNWGLFQE